MKLSVGFLSALFLLFAVSCKNPVTPSGTVSGTVKLFDGNGNPLPNDGVTVSLSGSSITATAQTNSDGYWQINGLPMLPATFIYTKQGFGSTKIFSFQVDGRDTVDVVNMDKPPTELINFQTFKMSKSNGATEPTYYIQGAAPDPEYRGDSLALILCISSDSAALVKDPANAAVLLPFAVYASGYDGSFVWNSTNALLLSSYPYTSGTKVYATLIVVGVGKSDYNFAGLNSSNYFDPVQNKQVFTALGPFVSILKGVIP